MTMAFDVVLVAGLITACCCAVLMRLNRSLRDLLADARGEANQQILDRLYGRPPAGALDAALEQIDGGIVHRPLSPIELELERLYDQDYPNA